MDLQNQMQLIDIFIKEIWNKKWNIDQYLWGHLFSQVCSIQTTCLMDSF